MYDEESFSRHIFFMKFKRTFMLILFSIIGCIIGIVLSTYLIGLFSMEPMIRIPIITGSTLLFFFFSLISSAKINRDIQDGYWKIAVLRKLTLISKKLDALDTLGKLEKLNYLEDLNTNVSKTLTEVEKNANRKPVKFKKISKK